MYCIKCGVKLADTENKCPLCGTTVFHPDINQPASKPLYPENKMPPKPSNSKVLSGALIIVYFIPLLICFIADLNINGTLDWFGYVAGALLVAYVTFALPLWFQKPNMIIFVPCDFACVALYLWYINFVTGGNWFFTFAFPVVTGIGVIVCTVVTLICCLNKGHLYIFGGAFIALGGFMLLAEFLLDLTFKLAFIGWSVYPMVVLILLGILLIYLAINHSAREMLERKLFF